MHSRRRYLRPCSLCPNSSVNRDCDNKAEMSYNADSLLNASLIEVFGEVRWRRRIVIWVPDVVNTTIAKVVVESFNIIPAHIRRLSTGGLSAQSCSIDFVTKLNLRKATARHVESNL